MAVWFLNFAFKTLEKPYIQSFVTLLPVSPAAMGTEVFSTSFFHFSGVPNSAWYLVGPEEIICGMESDLLF